MGTSRLRAEEGRIFALALEDLDLAENGVGAGAEDASLSQQYTNCARFWKSRAREVSQERSAESPLSMRICLFLNAFIHSLQGEAMAWIFSKREGKVSKRIRGTKMRRTCGRKRNAQLNALEYLAFRHLVQALVFD